MSSHSFRSNLPHFKGASIALGLLALMGALFWAYCIHTERACAQVLCPEVSSLKNQGAAIQRLAFEGADILPLYGSSELVKPIADKASEFFKHAPTSFVVCPVGHAGVTPLIMMEKLASIGSLLKRHKIAISLSHSWFLDPIIKASQYEGNFSPLHASAVAFDFRLSYGLRHDLAQRMVEYPQTLKRCPSAAFALRHLAGSSLIDRLLYYASVPSGELENAVLRLQDHLHSLLYIHEADLSAVAFEQKPLPDSWPHLLESVGASEISPSAPEKQVAKETPQRPWDGDAAFIARIQTAQEWADLELLLRGLKEMHANPLILSMPLPGVQYEQFAISMQARQVYYRRLQELCDKYGFPVLEFQDHDHDPDFLTGNNDHMSAKGWMFYNKTLDDFFHDRLPLKHHRHSGRQA